MQDAPTATAELHSVPAARAPIVGSWRAWAELLRISNLPTILADCAVGLCIAMALYAVWRGPTQAADVLSENPALIAGVCVGMCMLYLGGMVLNGILDRNIDAVERPNRPIPSGRIPLRVAWTVAVVLMLGGLWPSSLGRAPIPEIAAATVAIWLSAYANRSANPALTILAHGWMVIAVIAAIWWMAVPLVTPIGSDVAEDLPENALAQMRLGMRMTYAPALVIALAAVAYNVLHSRTAWSVALMALCRALVPVSVAMAALAPSGIFGPVRATWIASGRIPTDLAFLLATTAIALMLHTLALSLAARREVDASARKACGVCGHALAPGEPPARCSECGADFSANPPSIPPAPEDRAIGIVGTLGAAALIVGVAILTPRLTATGWRFGAAPATGQDTLLGFTVNPVVVTWAIMVTVAVPLTLFVAAALRGHSVANGHLTRRPSGIARLVAAIALLDAAACWALGYPLLGAVCIGLYLVARLMQRTVPAS
jgi:4-hydroxybenzoate polyprenyltransferase